MQSNPDTSIPTTPLVGRGATERLSRTLQTATSSRLKTPQRRRGGEVPPLNGSTSPIRLDQSVEKHPIHCIRPYLEAEQNDVLIECVPLFREFRRVASDRSSSQVMRPLNELEQLRLWEDLHLVKLLLDPVTLRGFQQSSFLLFSYNSCSYDSVHTQLLVLDKHRLL